MSATITVTKEQREALSSLLDATEIRQGQYKQIHEGNGPSDVCDELYDCGDAEAGLIAESYSHSIKVGYEMLKQFDAALRQNESSAGDASDANSPA